MIVDVGGIVASFDKNKKPELSASEMAATRVSLSNKTKLNIADFRSVLI